MTHRNARYASAELALRADMVRGLVTRLSVLCESLEDEDGGADDSWDGLATTSLPARAETGWAGQIKVSDYRFPDDEEGADSAARLKELLGIEATQSDFDCAEAFGSEDGGSAVKGKGGGDDGGGGSSSSSKTATASTTASAAAVAAAVPQSASSTSATQAATATTAADPTMLYAAGAAVLAAAAGVVLMFGGSTDE